MDQKLTKAERLKSRKQIARLFSGNSSAFSYPVKFNWAVGPGDQQMPVQVMFSVSKRNFKRAVDRNRIKRLLKESYRKNKWILYNELETNQGKLILACIYVGKEILSYEDVRKAMEEGLKKIAKQLNSARKNQE